jgi:diacylglycerol kinase (ATP)
MIPPVPPRRVQIVANPHAGSWRRTRLAALKAAFEAAGAVVTMTQSVRGPLAIADDVDHVCVVGGDGTVRHVAAVVRGMPRGPSISVYPLGTVNLLARECGYSADPEAFVRRAITVPARRSHHIALIGDIPMLTCASVGPDSRTVAILSPGLKRLIGRGAYIAAFCRVVADWPRPTLRIAAGDRTIVCEAVYIAKGRFYAGGWSFAPAATVEDALLHVVAIERASRVAILRFACDLLRGRVPRGVIAFTCSALTISGGEGVPVQADGDIVAHLPVRIAIAPETLAFA